MHGGKSKRGTQAPAFKHGKYSKLLPERLSERYNELITDVDLLQLMEEIALVDTLVCETLHSLDRHGDNAEIWNEILQLIEQRRKLVMSQIKIIKRNNQYLSIDQLMVLVSRLVDIVETHVKDKTTLQNISDDIRGLIQTDKSRMQ
jgi:hypothetical protein